ncbi:GldM family protein [Taibaiella koreensis]|uniref:GldM family protein n=1 Tax=Taibaiella koreensis TaxID=1268548 RepID=UPI000E59DF18|nr:GldM family protein [Taibaiella koreensis]
MKIIKLLSFGIALLLPGITTAQQFTVGAPVMNLAYIGVPNPITVVSGSCGCDALQVSVSEGTLEKTGNCQYDFRPSRQGTVQLTVAEKKGGKTKVIHTSRIRVKSIPEPHASVGGRKGGEYPIDEFKVQSGVSAVAEGFEMDLPVAVVAFDLKINRSKVQLAEEHGQGAYFSASCKASINKLLPGDTLKIENVKIISADGRVQLIQGVVYTMK